MLQTTTAPITMLSKMLLMEASAKVLFSSTTLTRDLAYIKSDFSIISKQSHNLEETGVKLCDAFQLVTNVESELKPAHGKVGECVNAELQSLLGQNEDW